MGAAALDALALMLEPARLGLLAFGVVVGLALGVIPGLGGLIGLSLLLPFTYSMDPYAALAMLIGLTAVTTTSDTIPAVLFGVPGTVGSAATVLDGHPMAKRGEASRALGAAFTASLLGGLFGALLLGLSMPLLRPVMLAIATPELLGFCIFGLSLVAALSGGDPAKGAASACLGLLLAMVGEDSQAGEMRWTFGSIYLWDGLQLVPLALGLFALPELADLAIKRTAIAETPEAAARAARVTQLDGVRDVIRRPFLMLRCSAIGSLLGAVPGLGSAVIDWIAYGHAARTERGAAASFGHGDVRGVIASESSNNAKEGGALVPTIAFGVPGSASMALLLGAFTVHGIVPGPEMLASRLDVTYSLVWSVALANILGAGLCFLGARQLARLAQVRAGLLVPSVLAVAYVGAFQSARAWEDLYLLLAAGALGFAMKRLGWPRPPVILGFVLGALVERYAFISVARYGEWGWMMRPVVMVTLLLAAWGLLAPLLGIAFGAHRAGRRVVLSWRGRERPAEVVFAALLLALFVAAYRGGQDWSRFAAMAPQAVAVLGGLASAAVLASTLFLRSEGVRTVAPADLSGQLGLPLPLALARGAAVGGWLLFLLAASAIVGMLPAIALFLVGWFRLTAREGWTTTLAASAAMVAGIYLVFHWVLVMPWPDALIGDLVPRLRSTRAFSLF